MMRIRPDEYERLAARLGLEPGSPAKRAFALRCLTNLDDAAIAAELHLPVAEVTAALEAVRVRLTTRPDRPANAQLEWYRELLAMMRGARHHNPPTAPIGFSKYHPNDPAHAQQVAVRAKILTAEDLATGDAWRRWSVVEQAQRGKPERRKKRQKKERRG